MDDEWVDLPQTDGYEISVYGEIRRWIDHMKHYEYPEVEKLDGQAVVRLRNRDTHRAYPHFMDDLMVRGVIKEMANPDLYELVHIDGNPMNCRLDNYGWRRLFIPVNVRED